MGAVVVLVWGCNEGAEPGRAGAPAHSGQHQQPLTNSFVSAALPTKKLQVGEECTQYEGSSACESDLCLRVAPGFPPKGFCTLKCPPGDDTVCPDGPYEVWRCVQFFPSGADGWACAPVVTHASVVATLRGAKVPLPPKALAVAEALGMDGGGVP